MIVEGLGFHLAPLRLPTTETQPGGLFSFHAKKVQKIPLITHAFFGTVPKLGDVTKG